MFVKSLFTEALVIVWEHWPALTARYCAIWTCLLNWIMSINIVSETCVTVVVYFFKCIKNHAQTIWYVPLYYMTLTSGSSSLPNDTISTLKHTFRMHKLAPTYELIMCFLLGYCDKRVKVHNTVHRICNVSLLKYMYILIESFETYSAENNQ